MEKRKRWQFWLIVTVLGLTLYNILPTVFYYSNPLKEPIGESRAEAVVDSMVTRVDELEEDAVSWIYSFSKMLGTKPDTVTVRENNPQLIDVTFAKESDASLFRKFLPRAGRLINFIPSQLRLYQTSDQNSSVVTVAREIGVKLSNEDKTKLFKFASVDQPDGGISPLYKEVIFDRMSELTTAFGGASRQALMTQAVVQNPNETQLDDAVIALAKDIVDVQSTFGDKHDIAKRYFASFTQIDANTDGMTDKLATRMDSLKEKLNKQLQQLATEKKQAEEGGLLLSANNEQTQYMLRNQIQSLEYASNVLKKNSGLFKTDKKPLTQTEITAALEKGFTGVSSKTPVQTLSLNGRNPFVKNLVLDWNNGIVETEFYEDVTAIRFNDATTESEQYLKDRLQQLVVNDIARVSRTSDEEIKPTADTFGIELNKLSNTHSILTMDLGSLAKVKLNQFQNLLTSGWTPKHADLARDVFPISDYDSFKTLPTSKQKLGLILFAPAASDASTPTGFRNGSIYVIARGLNSIAEKYRQSPEAPESRVFMNDFNQLNEIMQSNGFIGYPGSSYGVAPEFSKDYIFELEDYYSTLLKATREDFTVLGSKKYAVLDFTNVEQRLLTENLIDDRVQEDLLKWKEEYQSSRVDTDMTKKFLIAPPTKSAFWNNIKLSATKYFRGDERKTLKWGLDLSGGKTVRIGLRDHNNQPVTNRDDLNQAVNELYTRINKMGVSERTIRIENNNVILEFPGSQAWSAADLIKASAMYFHIVNEKFSPANDELREAVNQFLQDVWNEAVVTNRKDVESINEIAWQQLGGEAIGDQEVRPRSDAATILYDNGLRIANPKQDSRSSRFNDTLSSIALLREDDYKELYRQPYPLVIVFHNYALEGSSLTNVQVGYDPKEGNVLSFAVKGSYDQADRAGSPRQDLYAWTSQFAEEKIAGTPIEHYTHGRGWKMAVILNDTVISMPSLRAALETGGTISGRFTQREINQLAADLKAGSLSFTPKILSEENVSPELGSEERMHGIIASVTALVLVVVAMVGYYRFAGLVASCAVLLNLFIMWGVLQNLGAALNLPAIAGIVLTIGMAVDANVLVFERIREEFALSGRIASAIQAGYSKAFSAIIDSNITTLIAAIILIQFDSGPIKGFAITLIIGILSSMFTSLFLTRYFFAGWVQNPNNKSLAMSQWIRNPNFNFIGTAKTAISISIAAVVLGGYLFFAQGSSIFGMDFTGGYSLTVQVQEQPNNPNYRLLAATALEKAGASQNDFSIRELSLPNQLRIQLGTNMEESGHPFNTLPEVYTEGSFEQEYEKNPRIVWVVDALEKGGLQIQESDLGKLDRNWSVISGQLSDAMRNNALIALAAAIVSILIYITIRFEFNFAVSAVIGLVHDVLITLGILAMFFALGFPVQIDLTVIGAIMTIIGYSLNDTIIVFDRIREDMRLMRKVPFAQVINHALNVTLSRTLMTSGTTLLVLFTLVILGGHSIFTFSLVMTIGVLVGTLSSLFIAPPMLLYLHRREEERNGNGSTASYKNA